MCCARDSRPWLINRKGQGNFLFLAFLAVHDKNREHHKPEEETQEQAPKEDKYRHIISLLIEKITKGVRVLQICKIMKLC